MSNQRKNKSTMNFVFCDPQHEKWVIPVTKELQCSNRKKINMTSFFLEKSFYPLLAPMQNKEDPTSIINMTSMGKIA